MSMIANAYMSKYVHPIGRIQYDGDYDFEDP